MENTPRPRLSIVIVLSPSLPGPACLPGPEGRNEYLISARRRLHYVFKISESTMGWRGLKGILGDSASAEPRKMTVLQLDVSAWLAVISGPMNCTLTLTQNASAKLLPRNATLLSICLI